MKGSAKRRPCWVVLAPGKLKAIEKVVFADEDDHDDRTIEVRDGKTGYVAIIQYEPGSECSGDEDLARTLSKDAKKPAYVLWLNDESPRIQAFAKGTYAGEVSAWPDSVARELGCSFPQMTSGGGKVDLTPRTSPTAKQGELTIARWTIAQWKHMMKHDSEWSVLLDGATEKTAAEALAALTHADKDVREVACKLVKVIGIYGYGDKASDALAVLRTLETSDPDKRVRAVAKQAAVELADAIETRAVRAEFPWLTDYGEKSLPDALAALDDDREAVRRHVYAWWTFAHIPAAIGKKVATKLQTLIAKESDKETRKSAEQALERVRDAKTR